MSNQEAIIAIGILVACAISIGFIWWSGKHKRLKQIGGFMDKDDNNIAAYLRKLVTDGLMNNLPTEPTRVYRSSQIPQNQIYSMGNAWIMPYGVDWEVGPPVNVEKTSYDATAVMAVVEAAIYWRDLAEAEESARQELFKRVQEMEKTRVITGQAVKRYWSQKQF